ncbi:MAG: hypothetical protein U1E52_00580 [Geminicoccaceae bacterium]
MPRIDDHVGGGGMWRSTQRAPGWPGWWWKCAAVSKVAWLVALAADGIALGAQLQAMGLVAARAGDPGRGHLALRERAVIVYLALHPSVGVVGAGVEQRRAEGVEQGPADGVAVALRRAAGMARRAHLGLGMHRQRRRPCGDRGVADEAPLIRTAVSAARRTVNPWLGSSADAPPCAQATCAEPGPWQASQETFSAEKVVW